MRPPSHDDDLLKRLERYQVRLIFGLRHAQSELGWSQAEHARRAGLDQTYLSKIMTGVKTPSQVVEESLIAATGIPPWQVHKWGEESMGRRHRVRERSGQRRLESEGTAEACLEVIAVADLTDDDLARIRDAAAERLEGRGGKRSSS